MFDATFENVIAVLEAKVNPDGRLPRIGKYKNCNVSIVIIEGYDDTNQPAQQKLVVLTNEEVAKAFPIQGE